MLSINGILLLIMFVAGGLAATQSAINAQLSNFLASPLQASFISFCVGTIVLGVVLFATRQGLPTVSKLSQLPPQYLIGGLCGSVFITSAIFLVPKIGVVNVLFLGLAGQMIVSIAIDNFGLFGLKVQPLTTFKVVGLLLIIAGVALLKHETASSKAQLTSHENQSHGESRVAGIQSDYAADKSVQLLHPPTGSIKVTRLTQHKQRREQKRIACSLRMRVAANIEELSARKSSFG